MAKKCKIHPKYKGIREPKSKKKGCTCMAVYLKAQEKRAKTEQVKKAELLPITEGETVEGIIVPKTEQPSLPSINIKKYPILIALSGPKGCGKTTMAKFGVGVCGADSIVPLAAELKLMAMKFFGLTKEQVYGSEKEIPFAKPIIANDRTLSKIVRRMSSTLDQMGLGDLFNPHKIALNLLPRGPFNTPRELMQKLGTEIMQAIYKDYSILATIMPIAGKNGIFFVDDMRFPREDELLREKSHFYYSVCVTGRKEKTKDVHSSEHAWKEIDFFATVENGGSIKKFQENILKVFQKIKEDVIERVMAGDIPPDVEGGDNETQGVGRGRMGRPEPVQVRWHNN